MTWNYQWTNRAAYNSKVVLSHFPSAFRKSNVLVTDTRRQPQATTPRPQKFEADGLWMNMARCTTFRA
jgi:hypothetical protein